MGVDVVLEELVPMVRANRIFEGVKLLELKLEFLSGGFFSSRFVFPMNDLVAGFPNFEPVSPDCAYGLNRPG